MSATFLLTEATDSDLEELSVLINSAYRGDSSRLGWTTEADYLDGQRTDPATLGEQISEKVGNKILCLRETSPGPILGCVFLERFHDGRGIGCYLGMLTVNPKLQAKGVGTVLMKSAEQVARSWGASHVTLGVIQVRETLMNWYERRGYSKTGETEPFPYGDEKFGIPKRDDLHFVMFEKAITT